MPRVLPGARRARQGRRTCARGRGGGRQSALWGSTHRRRAAERTRVANRALQRPDRRAAPVPRPPTSPRGSPRSRCFSSSSSFLRAPTLAEAPPASQSPTSFGLAYGVRDSCLFFRFSFIFVADRNSSFSGSGASCCAEETGPEIGVRKLSPTTHG